MGDYTSTKLWQRTLALQPGTDPEADQRERLRVAYKQFRDRASVVAGEIARYVEYLTVHDVTHLDALWETADLAVGETYPITPAEAFVLGGAFLVHDLGMAMASYQGGLDALRKESVWLDTVALIHRERTGRHPTVDQVRVPDPEIEKEAVPRVLRALHAQRADQLATASWADPQSGEPRHLLEDEELRQSYGSLIGRVAHSHWWPVNRLVQEFPVEQGAPPQMPPKWTVDPLKVACILRIADAAHLDARRAPSFLRTIRQPQTLSRDHWIFQGRLNRPKLDVDRLVYTSGAPCPIEEAESWWLCLEALRLLDRELRDVDAILGDSQRPRFAAREVAGIQDPIRLAKLIPTKGWTPGDAQVRVTDVAGLVAKLGGQELYGRDPSVPLRELVQNAADAIRARRLLEELPGQWGDVCVRIGCDNGRHWIQVDDNGVGMSAEVLLVLVNE